MYLMARTGHAQLIDNIFKNTLKKFLQFWEIVRWLKAVAIIWCKNSIRWDSVLLPKHMYSIFHMYILDQVGPESLVSQV